MTTPFIRFGRSIYGFSTPMPESRLRFNNDFGALLA